MWTDIGTALSSCTEAFRAADAELVETPIPGACSLSVRPHAHVPSLACRARKRDDALIRDATRHVFGYQRLEDARGGFARDHLFGF